MGKLKSILKFGLPTNEGFTLIEMVLIIVILGVLSAVAIPQFINLRNDADAANNMAYMGAVNSVMSMRFALETVQDIVEASSYARVGTAATLPGLATASGFDGLIGTAVPSSLTSGTDCASAASTVTWSGLAPVTGGAPVCFDWVLGAAGTAVDDPINITAP